MRINRIRIFSGGDNKGLKCLLEPSQTVFELRFICFQDLHPGLKVFKSCVMVLKNLFLPGNFSLHPLQGHSTLLLQIFCGGLKTATGSLQELSLRSYFGLHAMKSGLSFGLDLLHRSRFPDFAGKHFLEP